MDRFFALISEFKGKYPDGKLLENEPMSRHTTLGIGGPVKAMFLPESEDEAAYVFGRCAELGVPYLVLGNGSNLLFSDDVHDIAVIKTAGLNSVSADGNVITAGAGVMLARIASAALTAGLTGFEFAHGIPGSLGGALVMNAGAYGGEMKDVVESVTVLKKDGRLEKYGIEQCGFSYRHSAFESGDLVLSGRIRLEPGDRDAIKEKMNDLASRRREKQPLDMMSAGSTFKRPENGYAAALIDEAGLKGTRVGGAMVSEKHAGFLVNAGGATFDDFTGLMEKVQKTVFERSGIMLEPEVKIIH